MSSFRARAKEFLEDLRISIARIAQGLGITLNLRKTRICKLSSRWRFLQIQYSLTETGRISRKINPKRLTAERRKMKKLATWMTRREFADNVHSWWESSYKYMSKQQRKNFLSLFIKLKEETKHDENDTTRRYRAHRLHPEWE